MPHDRGRVVIDFPFFRKNPECTVLFELAFLWAMVGRLLYELARSVVRRHLCYRRGYLDGVTEVLARRRRDRARSRAQR